MCCSVKKSGVPRPVTYASQSQPISKAKNQSLAGRTGAHPAPAENPAVLQPGLEPDMMSLRPAKPLLYNQGLRKPSGGLPFEIKKSLSSEIIPATVCNSTTRRAAQIAKFKNMSCQVTAENGLVEAVILAAEGLEEGGNSIVLVARAQKV